MSAVATAATEARRTLLKLVVVTGELCDEEPTTYKSRNTSKQRMSNTQLAKTRNDQ